MFLPYRTTTPLYYFPWCTIALIGTNAAVLVLQLAVLSDGGIPDLALRHGAGLHPSQWLTSNFIHAGLVAPPRNGAPGTHPFALRREAVGRPQAPPHRVRAALPRDERSHAAPPREDPPRGRGAPPPGDPGHRLDPGARPPGPSVGGARGAPGASAACTAPESPLTQSKPGLTIASVIRGSEPRQRALSAGARPPTSRREPDRPRAGVLVCPSSLPAPRPSPRRPRSLPDLRSLQTRRASSSRAGHRGLFPNPA